MTVRVLALQSGVTDLVSHRYHESAGFTQAGVGNARSGIIPTAGAADVSQVSSMVVAVAGFAAWIDGTASANQAGYNVVADAPTQLTIAAGEASVARTDRIWAVVYQDTYDGSGQTKGAVEYAKGQATGAAQPLPASAILLWEFSVPAGASAATGGVAVSSFVDKRVFTVAAGGILPAVSQADRDAITNPYKGQAVWRQEYGHLEIWDNKWRPQGVPALTGASVAAGHLTDPVDGQLFFARDTRALYQYDAAAGQWKPYWAAGQLFARQTSDIVTTSTTLQNTMLSLPMAANAVYKLESRLGYVAVTAAQVKFAWSIPSGTVMKYTGYGLSPGDNASLVQFTNDQTATLTAGGFHSTPDFDLSVVLDGIVRTGSTPGNLVLKFAPNLSTSSNTFFRTDSYLQLTRVS